MRNLRQLSTNFFGKGNPDCNENIIESHRIWWGKVGQFDARDKVLKISWITLFIDDPFLECFAHKQLDNKIKEFIVYQKGDIVKDPMKSIPFLPKIVPGVGWGGVGGSCRGGVGWGVSCRGGVGWGWVGHEGVGWGGSCRGGVGSCSVVDHTGVGYVM